MSEELLGSVIAFVLGALGRILIPYLLEWVNGRIAFDWRYIVGQLLAVIIALVPVTFNDEWVKSVSEMSALAAVSAGWFASDIGRLGQKFYNRVKGSE